MNESPIAKRRPRHRDLAVHRVPIFEGFGFELRREQKAPKCGGPGILPPSQMPYQVRSDYTGELERLYWFTNSKHTLDGYPLIIGQKGSPSRGGPGSATRWSAKLAGEGRFTLASAQRQWSSTTGVMAELRSTR